MTTLPRAYVAQLFTDSNTFVHFRQHWRTLVTSHRRYTLAAEHYLLYSAVCGRDWRAGFTPMTNARKLANGAYAGWGLFRALDRVHSVAYEQALLAPFDGLVSTAMLAQLRQLLPHPLAHRYRPGDFQPGKWSFDAYILPEHTEPTS